MIRAGDWKLTEAFETGEFSLFNLTTDLGEANNLAASEPGEVAQLHAKLKDWRRRVGVDMMKPNAEYVKE